MAGQDKTMQQDKKSNGALFGSFVIVIILILGGIYMWQSKVKNAVKEKANQTTTTQADNTQLNSIESDLNTTDSNFSVDTESIQ